MVRVEGALGSSLGWDGRNGQEVGCDGEVWIGFELEKNTFEFFLDWAGVEGMLEEEKDPDLSIKIYLTKSTLANNTVIICKRWETNRSIHYIDLCTGRVCYSANKN